MKDQELHNFIQAMNVPVPNMPRHQAELRRAILSAGQIKQTRSQRLRRALHNIRINHMPNTIKLAGAGILALGIAIGAGGTLLVAPATPAAKAAQVAKDSLSTYAAADKATQETVKTKIGTDPAQALQDAKAAKDVTALARPDFEAEVRRHQQATVSSGGTMSGAGGSNSPDGIAPNGSVSGGSDGEPHVNLGPNVTKFLRYTNAEGKIVFVGIDTQGLPAYMITFDK